MNQVSTIGFDLAKHVFQVHGTDAQGRLFRRKLRRKEVLAYFASLPPSLIGMEACGSAHYWARKLQALGHEVRLMPPAYVRPTSSGERTMRSMRKPAGRRSLAPTCALLRS